MEDSAGCRGWDYRRVGWTRRLRRLLERIGVGEQLRVLARLADERDAHRHADGRHAGRRHHAALGAQAQRHGDRRVAGGGIVRGMRGSRSSRARRRRCWPNARSSIVGGGLAHSRRERRVVGGATRRRTTAPVPQQHLARMGMRRCGRRRCRRSGPRTVLTVRERAAT